MKKVFFGFKNMLLSVNWRKRAPIIGGVFFVGVCILILIYSLIQQNSRLEHVDKLLTELAYINGSDIGEFVDRNLQSSLAQAQDYLASKRNSNPGGLYLIDGWKLERDRTLDSDIYLAVQFERDSEPFTISKYEMGMLLKAILGGTREVAAERFELVTIKDSGNEVSILLDKYHGNTWMLQGNRFTVVDVERVPDLKRSNTQLGETIDIFIEKTGSYRLYNDKD